MARLTPFTSECQAVLQGHTSLVGQLQMRADTLVTGGSDGSVRVWSLSKFVPIHRLAAHDNSVTSLQFDDTRVVSGGSDGRVKVWDLKTGHLVRELIAQGEAVWRVAFEDEKCVAMALRNNRTIMEVSAFFAFNCEPWLMVKQVWCFSPPPDDDRPFMKALEGPDRPKSALALDWRQPQPTMLPGVAPRDSGEDVEMNDAGPSTAPLQGGGSTFFHD